jgi:Fur family transcriptional regulator, ferric uptake regulator
MNTQPAQRNTRQRQVVLEELQKLATHPTAAGLYGIVRRRLPKISLGTVYRNLELLARQGTIQKLDLGSQQARFDGDVHRHDHVQCVQCGRVDDIHGPPLDLPGGSADDSGGYQIFDYRLQYLGLCPRCRATREKGDRPRGCEPFFPQNDSSHTTRETGSC